VCGYPKHRDKLHELTPRDAASINSREHFSRSEFGDTVNIRRIKYRDLIVFYIWGCACVVAQTLGLTDSEYDVEIFVPVDWADDPTLFVIGACLSKDVRV